MNAAARSDVILVVPDLVIQECVQTYSEFFQRQKPELERSLGTFRRMGLLALSDSPELPKELEAARSSYEKDLRSILEEAGARIPPTPQVPHEKVIRRSLSRRKPMARSEKGYRDTLIWETVLLEAASIDEVAFLSTNHKDFADETKSCLAPDLVDDLKEASLAPNAVRLWTDVKQFVSDQLAPNAVALRNMRALLTSDLSYFKMLEEYLEGLLEYGMPVQMEFCDSDFEDASLGLFHGFDEIDVVDVRELANKMIVVTLQGEGEAEIEASMARHDLWARDDWNPPQVLHGDWNEHFSRVLTVRHVQVTFEAPYVIGDPEDEEAGLQEVISFEIEAAGPTQHFNRPQDETLF